MSYQHPASAPYSCLLALEGGDRGTAGLAYGVINIDRAQLKHWRKHLEVSAEVKGRLEGLLDLRTIHDGLGVCESLPEQRSREAAQIKSIIEEQLPAQRHLVLPDEMMEKLTEEPGRIGFSALEVGSDHIRWTLQPKHVDLELSTPTLYEDALERFRGRLEFYHARNDEKRRKLVHQFIGQQPKLGLELLQEMSWLQRLDLQPARWQNIGASDFSKLLSHEDDRLRRQALRLVGQLPGQQQKGQTPGR